MDKNWGWIKDPEDKRDITFSTSRSIGDIPLKVDFRSNMTPVENQGWTSSCVAQACVGALEYLYVKKILNKRWPCLKPRDYSRMFVYWYARLLDNLHTQDGGCTIRSAMKALNKHGVCKEKYYEFDLKYLFQEPNKEARDKASNRKIENYHRVTTVHEFLSSLAEERPVVFGALLYESFLNPENGQIKMPGDDKQIGAHAMCACGYELTNKESLEGNIIVRNSWGEDWGIKGYCKMPLSYFKPIGYLVDDCWSINIHPKD
jgi:C1A family cysteine protease